MRSICFSLAILFHTALAHAYTYSVTDRGTPVRWGYGQKIMLAGNPSNTGNYPQDLFRKGLVKGLQLWKQATGGALDFDYWQGTDPEKYPAQLASDGLGTVFFASHSSASTDPNVISYTQVWFNSTNGNIIETDTLLNDRNFEFTPRPADTTSANPGMRPKVFLDSILTHELGHAIGLGHSGDINASMLFVEAKEQFRTGCDDAAGARHVYGQMKTQSTGQGSESSLEFGSLGGWILGPTSAPIGGAQVIAISKSTGIPEAHVLTDRSGRFHFGSLEPDSYALAIKPYPGSADSIPPEYQPFNRKACSGADYPLQFVTAKDEHTLIEWNVRSREHLDAGAVAVHCNPVSASGGTSADELAPSMFVDTGPSGRPITYSTAVNGEFQITTLTQLLLSPIRVQVEVFDSAGRRLPIQTISPIYESESGFKISEVRIRGRAQGRIQVRVTPSPASDPLVSSRALAPNPFPFFALSFHSGFTNDSARCLAPESFPEYLSPPGDPIRFAGSNSARERIGFCGTPVANASELRGGLVAPSHRGGRVGTRLEVILGWFWPFGLILAFQLNSRRRRAKLSSSCRSAPFHFR